MVEPGRDRAPPRPPLRPWSSAAARERTARDLARLARRAPAEHFWRSLALIGSVGWPIAFAAIGGAALGRVLDVRFDSGVRFTLLFLTIATALGTWAAFRLVRRAP